MMTYEFHLSADKKFKQYIHTHTHMYYYEKMLTSFGTYPTSHHLFHAPKCKDCYLQAPLLITSDSS